jgi:hypothetical protein
MTAHRPDFKLNRPGALIAALPAVLGFVPEKSLVLVAIERGEMGAVLRVDLSEELVDRLAQLAELIAAGRPDAVIAVIVDPEAARCPMCNEEHRQLCEDLTQYLRAHRISLIDAHVVDQVGPGGRWHCLDGCGSGGTVDDPASSPVTMAAVLDGRRLYDSRADLEAVIAVPDDDALGHDVACAIDRLAADGTPGRMEDPAAAVRHAMEAAQRVGAGGVLTASEVAAVGHALTDLTVRDTLYGLAVGDMAGAAECLWASLSRALPPPWRVETLTLLGFFAYARGDGPLAGVSLEAALRIDPAHRMAGMLDTALQSGMRPERIRQLAMTGYRLAERVGVELPPRRSGSRRAG